MTMDEILESVIELAENDNSISDTSVIKWVNQAINRINTAIEADIPLVSDFGNIEPAFDSRYHEALVLFSVAKYREGDSSYSDANYFMLQFNDMLKDMQRDMVVPPSLKKSNDYQQIKVTTTGISAYSLVIPSGSYFTKMEVFHNDNLLNTSNYRVNSMNQIITFVGISLVKDDKITIHFENSSDLNNPPHQWWGTSGW